MTEMDLSVFRKQRKITEKKDKKRKKREAIVSREHAVRDEKVIGEIRALETRITEDMVMKKDIEKEMKETRMIMYITLVVTLAIFAFLIGVLVRYMGK